MSASDPEPPSPERDGGAGGTTPATVVRGFAVADGEDVVYAGGPTRTRWVGHVLGALAVVAVVFLLDAGGLGYYGFPEYFLTAVVGVAAAFAIARAAVMWLRVRYFVTTRRLVVRGVFSVVAAVPLDDVTGVTADASGLGDLLGYSTVTVHTADSSVRLPFVAGPDEIARAIESHGGS